MRARPQMWGPGYRLLRGDPQPIKARRSIHIRRAAVSGWGFVTAREANARILRGVMFFRPAPRPFRAPRLAECLREAAPADVW